MPGVLRLTLALFLGSAVSVVIAPTASAKTHHAPKKKKSTAKHAKKKSTSKKKFTKKKKLARKKKAARKSHRRARKKLAPRRHRARPTVVHAPPPAPKPIPTATPPANAYSVSPDDANLPMPKTEAIPLRVPGEAEEEKSVRLDMTRPYGAATPAPAPSGLPKRGIASEGAATPDP